MFDINTLLYFIVPIILIAILVPCIFLFILYRRYVRLAKALPDPNSIQQTQPEMLDEKRDSVASILLSDWSKVPEHEVEVTRHALWTAMLLEAASDGSIDHREMRFVADLFGQMAGKEVDFRPVIQAAELVQSDKKSALAEISKASRVSNPSKEHVLAGAFLVSVSDHALTESETDCLGAIADALAISQRNRKAIFEGITKRLGI
ncbi:MAG: TerB family tellurite resistance protein [Methyloligellaceae bacterium]